MSTMQIRSLLVRSVVPFVGRFSIGREMMISVVPFVARFSIGREMIKMCMKRGLANLSEGADEINKLHLLLGKVTESEKLDLGDKFKKFMGLVDLIQEYIGHIVTAVDPEMNRVLMIREWERTFKKFSRAVDLLDRRYFNCEITKSISCRRRQSSWRNPSDLPHEDVLRQYRKQRVAPLVLLRRAVEEIENKYSIKKSMEYDHFEVYVTPISTLTREKEQRVAHLELLRRTIEQTELEDKHSIMKCMEEYGMIGGFTFSEDMKVYHLFQDKDNREIFLSLKGRIRVEWLCNMLGLKCNLMSVQ